MKYTRGEKKDGKIVIEFSLDAKEWEKEVENAYNKNKGRYNIDGFRKGKVPRSVLEKTFGEYLFYEDAFNEMCPRVYQEMLDKEADIFPVDYPEIDVKSFTKEGVKFTATVTLLPEVKLGEYKGLEVKKRKVSVSAPEVEGELKSMQEKHARFVEVTDRAAKNGDLVNLNYSGSVDGVKFDGGTAEDQELELGSHTFIEGFEEQMVGMTIGEEKDLNVTFPEAYHSEALAGKPAVFAVKLLGIREKQLPELNDEFAADTTEFSTLEELKADIKKHIKEHKEHHADVDAENELIKKIVDASEVEIPAVMVENQLDRMVEDVQNRLAYQGLKFEDYLAYTGSSMEAYRDSRKDEAKNAVKTTLVLEEIVKAEKIEVTEADIDAKLEELAPRMGKTVEELKKTVVKGQEEYLKNTIISEKVIKVIKDLNKIV
ncbi:MAG: trigger factor [Clostridia bacterium]|nr:trigger factor [Clostridia bacterium]